MILNGFRTGLNCAVALAFTLVPVSAQFVPNHYILLLDDAAVTSRFATREEVQSAAAATYRTQIEARQRTVRSELAARQIPISGSVSTVLNAIFVTAPASRVPEMLAIPGVAAVRPMRRYQANLNRATQLMNAPAAWAQLGGQANAGAGIKIGIIDSGIDQTHPAFQDSSLAMPAGYPKCTDGPPCPYASSKIIVSRSYVRQLAGFTSRDPVNLPDDTSVPPPAATSQPDDYTPRDHLGHGTGVASVAAANQNTGAVTFTGMAPKAYLGIYKIAGTPGVNDGPTDQVLIMAIEDALKDGMDVASLSWGGQALTGALDKGAVCGNKPNVPCDPTAAAYEAAAQAGLVITVAAGNSGSSANNYPYFNSISSPSNAPSVISVGATTSSHVLTPAVSVNATNAPANVKSIPAALTDATFYPAVQGANTAPLIDVTSLGDDGHACSPLPQNSLQGAFALIQRGTTTVGTCLLTAKATNAQAAGAAGIIFYMADSATPSVVGGFTFNGPIVIISNADGVVLKNYIDANPGQTVTIDTAGLETELAAYNTQEAAFIPTPILPNMLATYSSFGPTPDGAIKPDLAATGGLDPVLVFSSGIYMAGQRLDPSGDLYSKNGYVAADGTSFAAPMTAGAAALVKQAHPTYKAADIKSALVNSAAAVPTDDQGAPVDVEWLGAGRLDAGAAIKATVTANPTSISFGYVKSASSLPVKMTFLLTNRASSPVNLSLAVTPNSTLTATTVAVDKSSLTLATGDVSAQTITVTLSGSLPAPGAYSGSVKVTGSGVALNIPYLFVVPDGVPRNIVLAPFGDIQGIPGQDGGTIALQVVDQFGAPVTGAPVTFSSGRGQVTLQSIDGEPACSPNNASTTTCNTDGYGFAYAEVILGANPATPSITVQVGTMSPLQKNAFILPVATITPGQVLNNASFQTAIAPGSVVAIKGSNLMDTALLQNTAQGYDQATTSPFPLALDGVNVSFDVPGANISAAAPIVAVSQNQINVQVPWEMQGQTSAQVKVTIDEQFGNPIRSNVVTVPIAATAPAFFLYNNGNTPDALDGNYHVITSSNPAIRGQFISLFVNGLGPVANTPADGAPGDNTTVTTTVPVVMIGGQSATVQYHGLAPLYAGLYQVNVLVPTNISAGNQPITISIGGNTSPSQTGGSSPQTIVLPVQ